MTIDSASSLELWGGHECTVNRVGDQWFDQTVRTGHEHRPEDLDRWAEIGIKALRYPVLWSASRRSVRTSRTGAGPTSGCTGSATSACAPSRA
jgi:hypothetical protein